VHSYDILVDCDEVAGLAFKPIKRGPKLFDRLSGLLWELNLVRLDDIMLAKGSMQGSAPPHQVCAPISIQRTITPHHIAQMPSNERDIQLAISAIHSNQVQSRRSAAAVYNVAHRTLHRRLAGIPSRRDCQPNSRKLIQVEEEVIVS
jgi:hypothetical protein